MSKKLLSSFSCLALALVIILTAVLSFGCSSGTVKPSESETDTSAQKQASETDAATEAKQQDVNSDDIIPDPNEVESVKIAAQLPWKNIDESCKDIENYEYVKDNGTIYTMLYKIKDNPGMINKAVEMNKKLDEAENTTGINKSSTLYKCEYTMKDGSKIYNSIRKTIDDEKALMEDFFNEIDDYAVKFLTNTMFTSDSWRED